MKSPILFEKYLPQIILKINSISNWSVGEHIDHSLNVLITINENITKSTPWEKRESFKILKSIVLFTGIIPRGKGKSPDLHVFQSDQGSVDASSTKRDSL